MKKLLTTFSIIIVLTVISMCVVFVMRLPQSVIDLLGFAIVASAIVAVLSGLGILGFAGYQWARAVKARADDLANKSAIVSTPHADYTRHSPTVHWYRLSTDGVIELNGTARMLVDTRRGDSGKVNQQLMLPESTQVIDALQFALYAERAIIKGKSDAGKTTFLTSLASHSKNVIVIDPHNSVDKWPANCVVVGGGENFAEIQPRLKWIYDTMQSRYQEMNAGKTRERQFEPITLITDEVLAVLDECPEASDYFRKLVTRARKVNISVYLGSHSELVKPLKLEGAGDLRESYVMVRLYYSYITGKRSVTVDEGNGEVQAIFNDNAPIVTGEPLQLPELVTVGSGIVTSTDKILDLFDSGVTTPTAICTKIYGYKKTDLVKSIRQTLIDHGRLG